MWGILAWMGCKLFSEASSYIDNKNLMSTPIHWCGGVPVYADRQSRYYINGFRVERTTKTDEWHNKYMVYVQVGTGNIMASEYVDISNKIMAENEKNKREAEENGQKYYRFEYPRSHVECCINLKTGERVIGVWIDPVIPQLGCKGGKDRIFYLKDGVNPDNYEHYKKYFSIKEYIPPKGDLGVPATTEEILDFRMGYYGKYYPAAYRKGVTMGLDRDWCLSYLHPYENIVKSAHLRLMQKYPDAYPKEKREKVFADLRRENGIE